MPATRTQVRKALASTIDGLADITGHAYTPEVINPNDAIVIEVDVRYDATMQRGADDMTVLVRLLTSGDMESAQERLDEMASDLKDGVEADDSLGGVVHYARVARVRGDSEGQIQVGQQTYAVVDVEVEIVA